MKGSTKFLRRIRIRGGEFDASARAMHRKAATENVSDATIERKLMSTKTTFKRVSLVAVAALGIGLLSAVPSNAAPTFADGTQIYSAGTQIVGGQASVVLTVDTSIVTNIAISGVGSLTAVPTVTGQPGGFTAPALSSTAVAGATSFTVTGSGSGQGNATMVFTSSATGTTTITATPLNATTGVPGTVVTKTITWISAGTTVVSPSLSTSILSLTTAAPGTSDATVIADKSAGQVANVEVILKDTNGVALNGQTLSATVTGPGLISWMGTTVGTGVGTQRVATSGVITANEQYLGISSDGTAGVSTITISDGTTVVSTETVTFTGAAATYVATPSFTNYAVGNNGVDGTTGNGAIKVKVTDANGNIVVNGTSVYAVSSNTAVATVTATALNTVSGYVYFRVVGVAAGTATITFENATSGATVTATSAVTVTSSVASTVTLAFDKTSYAPGEKMVLTLTANNAAGAGLADGTYAAFLVTPGLTSNVSLQGFPASAFVDAALVAGVETWTLYAPLAAGTITVTSTTGVSANLATAVQSLALTASASVAADTSAVDAANAATDAANYASDAADAATAAAEEATAAASAAQDSADAALAAVTALGARVAVLYAATRSQVLSLQALVIRLIKKLHA